MGLLIESDVWEPNQSLYVFILVSCFLSIFCLPQFSAKSNRAPTPFDYSVPASFLRFQRSFILLFSLCSVMEGLWSVFGEYEFEQYGVNREQMVLSLCVGYAAALFIGTFLGMLSDLIFETWMVVEHEKLGHRQDSLNDMFWIMAFTESASFMGSQVIANWLIPSNVETSVLSPSTAAVLLAILSIIFVTHGWKEVSQTAVWLLAWAQACVQFSIAVFWILWAPTIVFLYYLQNMIPLSSRPDPLQQSSLSWFSVASDGPGSLSPPTQWLLLKGGEMRLRLADGREVRLGLIYPCFLGARMLGSTVFPWFFSGPLSLRTEDCLVYVFIVMGFVLSIVAYDYQEIGVLVALFCLFHACVGLLLPSLARLRTMYIPNELRGGMMSLSLAPANAAILFVLLQRGYYQSIENSTIMAFAALGLFSAAGCLHLLKRLGKQPHQTWHKL
ncbi:hypothetical protein HYC85_002276 [Camellia sinensis]|uniref:Molybdate-anion transporter n=1 Tax=Camellia sinensis TaxID=4442 RepID=A0A7J7I980_CAMSI|nr:hypothetical protein HYC85_002276 [Camellia sinensis]